MKEEAWIQSCLDDPWAELEDKISSGEVKIGEPLSAENPDLYKP